MLTHQHISQTYVVKLNLSISVFTVHMVHVIVKFLKLVEFKNNTIMISIVWQDQIDSSGLFDYFSNYLN